MFIIYKYTSPSGKSYIGQTNDQQRRKRLHKNVDGCRALHAAIKKYGWNNMTYEVIETQLSLEEANILESYYIKTLNTMVPNGYNLTSGGNNFVLSDETKQKISKSRLGHIVSEETRKKISDASKGRVRLETTKSKISQSMKGRPGRAHTPESKQKIREAVSKRGSPSKETILKMSNARKGKSLSPEVIAKRQATRMANKEARGRY